MYQPVNRKLDKPERYPDSGGFEMILRSTDGSFTTVTMDSRWYISETNYPFPYNRPAEPLDALPEDTVKELVSMIKDCRDFTTNPALFELAKKWLNDIDQSEARKTAAANNYNW